MNRDSALGKRTWELAAALAISFVAAFLVVEPAGVAFPGGNGKIFYEGRRLPRDPRLCLDYLHYDSDTFPANTDGSGQTNLTCSPDARESCPAVSPDGS